MCEGGFVDGVEGLEASHLGFDAGEGEGDAGLPVGFEEVGGVAVEGDEVGGGVGEAEQHAEAEGAESAAEGAVGGIEAGVEVAFVAPAVHLFVDGGVVGLLVEGDAGAAGFGEGAVFFLAHGKDFDVDVVEASGGACDGFADVGGVGFGHAFAGEEDDFV